MANTIQIGNGSYNPQTGHYTTYDPQSGQLITKFVVMPQGANHDQIMAGLQNGSINIASMFAKPGERGSDANFLGGRSNVNVKGQTYQVFTKLKEQYPQISDESLQRYANQWVSDRIAAGWDANEVENMMKDITRNPNSVNEDFLNGVRGMIDFDEGSTRDGGATGANTVDPKQSIQDELREFAGRMMQTVGPDSPQAKRIAELAAAAGNKYATSTGMGPGGITSRGVATTAARAHTDLQTQREGIGAQALAAAGNQQLSVDQLNTQLQQQNQQAGVMNGANIGGLIGSGVGLVGGVIGTAYSGGSMAPAIPGLIAGGGAAGSAIGGTVSNNGPPISYGGGVGGTSKSNYGGRNWGSS